MLCYAVTRATSAVFKKKRSLNADVKLVGESNFNCIHAISSFCLAFSNLLEQTLQSELHNWGEFCVEIILTVCVCVCVVATA